MQTKLAAIGLIAAAGGGTWLATAPASGEYYEIGPQEAASLLVTKRMSGEVNDSLSGGGDITQRVYKRGQDEVVWEFSVAHAPVTKFVAALEPEGSGTRVSVTFAILDAELDKATASNLGEGRAFLTGLLEKAMEQHVDATLERRAFDEGEFNREMASYTLSNPLQARKFIRQIQKMEQAGGSAMEAHLREKIDTDASWNADGESFDSAAYEAPATDDW